MSEVSESKLALGTECWWVRVQGSEEQQALWQEWTLTAPACEKRQALWQDWTLAVQVCELVQQVGKSVRRKRRLSVLPG